MALQLKYIALQLVAEDALDEAVQQNNPGFFLTAASFFVTVLATRIET